jgi:hypothetical protein
MFSVVFEGMLLSKQIYKELNVYDIRVHELLILQLNNYVQVVYTVFL